MHALKDIIIVFAKTILSICNIACTFTAVDAAWDAWHRGSIVLGLSGHKGR